MVIGESSNDVEVRERYLLMWAGNPASGTQTVLGPATVYRAIGSSLRMGPKELEAACFRNNLWCRRKIGGQFSLLWTETPTIVHLEDSSNGQRCALGTFEMVSMICDTLYVDREHSRQMARLDESVGKWRSMSDGTLWPELVLLPAPRIALSDSSLLTDALNGGVTGTTRENTTWH
ncbi:MAG TPA: hypothetical protein VGG64_21600 [Pirellulales bacterium]